MIDEGKRVIVGLREKPEDEHVVGFEIVLDETGELPEVIIFDTWFLSARATQTSMSPAPRPFERAAPRSACRSSASTTTRGEHNA